MGSCAATVEEYLNDFFPDKASDEALDSLAQAQFGLVRTVGETDKQLRSRIHYHLGIDADEQFARKIETAIQEWDAEKES